MKSQSLRTGWCRWIPALAMIVSTFATAQADLLSQSPEVSTAQPGNTRMPKQQEKMALNYVNQPPMIPHSVDGYQVTPTFNRCLQCHSVENYRSTNAPRVSPTHFVDRDGKTLGNVAPARYFCLQCHVPQTDATPITGNTFTPSKGFGQ
ncbi:MULTISPECIES: nitrate reductase cytochrome c-type subunit [unclassified Symbiopectobacterium]|uniref:nitrate reductase cytochrome c-type subunit n=1 Tax=unclassified Symbiopectobacterium TaxID=2794573 RepID=UPI002225C077|nr:MULTISPECIES: nitrate reductase cytochrome c-type subunit [unclassified Symbiopectobacterium]MCW2473210.1 nitrate reductase cytochrome c-type subunit [Candidatus Symbiopectobacterium sp. NZEC151]MCW2484382.1 nitrate reductase cytochrome c-type subunit [Candidatus Symbiopectobacterium sp. NZEC127]